MEKSDTIIELAKALSAFQGELSPAIKDSTNPFFKSTYADLNSVWEVIREPLCKNGLSVTQLTYVDWKNQLYLETVLLHRSGEWVLSRYPIVSSKTDPQSVGSALTYARRYALSAMLGGSAEDDDAEGAVVRTATSTPEKSKPSPVKENMAASPSLKKLTPLGQYNIAQGLKTSGELVKFALEQGYTKEKIQAALGIEKSVDIKHLPAAAMVLFPKPEPILERSLTEAAIKMGATLVKKGEEP